MSTKTLGRGVRSYRLVIEGLPEQWVTHRSMVTATRKPGLSLSGSAKVVSNPVTSEVDVSSLSARITGPASTAAFAQRPTDNTWLTADLTAAATSMSVRSTTGWPTTGTLWMNSEAMDYTAAATASFTGLTRGALGTMAQSHYISTGGLLRYPEVTNRPVTLAGRRCQVYSYEENADPQGNGELWWSGMVSRDPTFADATWSLQIEPLTTLLTRTVNADIAEPVRPRGIYYPTPYPFSQSFNFNGNLYSVTFDGYFESNFEFVERLNTELASTLDSTTWIVRAVADGDTSWHLEMVTPLVPAADDFLYARDRGGDTIDPRWDPSGYPTLTRGGTPVSIGFSGATRYFWYPHSASLPGAGSVPRGYFGLNPTTGGGGTGAFPVMRLYLDGAVDVAGLSGVEFEWQALGSTWARLDQTAAVISINAAERYVETTQTRPSESFSDYAHAFTSATLPDIRLGRTFIGSEGGNLGAFLQKIVDLGPDGINAGSVPSLRAADFESLPDVFPSSTSRIVNRRAYDSFGDFSLIDVIKAECLLAGYALGTTETGLIRFFELRPPVPNAFIDETSTAAGVPLLIDRPLVTKSPPSWQPITRGLTNTVVLERGWSVRDEEYTQGSVTVRDVAAFGQSPRPQVIRIEPKSIMLGQPERYTEVVDCASKLFAMFAYPYAMISVGVDQRYFTASHGDIVYLTSGVVPNTADGTLGVVGLPGLVLGREAPPNDPEIRLTLFCHQANLAAYVPEFFIASAVDNGGNKWTITITPTIGGVTYDLRAFYAEDFRVRIWQWDSTTANVVDGAVVTVISSTSLSVQFDGVAALGANTWVLCFARSSDSSIVASQLSNCYVADSDGRIALDSGTLPAKVFS